MCMNSLPKINEGIFESLLLEEILFQLSVMFIIIRDELKKKYMYRLFKHNSMTRRSV